MPPEELPQFNRYIEQNLKDFLQHVYYEDSRCLWTMNSTFQKYFSLCVDSDSKIWVCTELWKPVDASLLSLFLQQARKKGHQIFRGGFPPARVLRR